MIDKEMEELLDKLEEKVKNRLDTLRSYQLPECPSCGNANPTCKYCVHCGEVIAPL